MASIDDILSKLDGDNALEKNASQRTQEELTIENQAIDLGLISKTEKVASQKQEGEDMNLQDIYNDAFGVDLEKSASVADENTYQEEGMDKEASYQEGMGELAGVQFRNGIDAKILDFAIKTAMNENPDSAAMKKIESTPSIFSGVKPSNPQLEVNRRADDKAIDTAPQYYTLEEKAVAKAALKAAIASGHPGDLSHKVISSHDEDMIQGGNQANA